jgi:acetyl esterase/lipase
MRSMRVCLLAWMLLGVATVGQAAEANKTAEAVEITADVVYGHKDGLAMTFDVLRPKQNANRAGVLFLVSGGWYSRWSPPDGSVHQFQSLLDKGFTMFIVRHGSSPKYVIPEVVDDVRRAVRHIRKNAARFGVDPERLGVTGGSAGGHLTLVLGTTGDDGDAKAKDELLRTSDRVAAVVAYYPPTDVRPWVLPDSSYYKNYPALRFDPLKAPAYSPLLAVSPDDAPALMVHGDQDKLVPLDHSQRILAEMQKKGVPCELLVIPGAAHGFRGEEAARASAARDRWFEKYLLNASRKPAASHP